jgi:hypothetical protein
MGPDSHTGLNQILPPAVHGPWVVLASYPWRHEEHINALEARACLTSLHHVITTPASIGARVVHMLDSSVVYYALRKGRSSSPSLTPILRRITALLLASGLSLLPVWVPTTLNPADAASRAYDPSCSELDSPPSTHLVPLSCL